MTWTQQLASMVDGTGMAAGEDSQPLSKQQTLVVEFEKLLHSRTHGSNAFSSATRECMVCEHRMRCGR